MLARTTTTNQIQHSEKRLHPNSILVLHHTEEEQTVQSQICN
jgi:hypothetical protein